MGVEYTVSNLKRVTLTDSQFREIASYTRSKEIEFLFSVRPGMSRASISSNPSTFRPTRSARRI